MDCRFAAASRASISLVILFLAACSGGDSGPPSTYAVGGTVSGLKGSGLVLANNGADALPVITNGPFIFVAPVAIGGTYNVTVISQPTSPVQNCVVMNSGRSGSVSVGDVKTANVVCANVGRFAYTGSRDFGTIVGFHIDPSTGALAEIPGGAPYFPWSGGVAVDPGGKFLYAEGNPGGVFAVNAASGALSSAGSMPFLSRLFLRQPVFDAEREVCTWRDERPRVTRRGPSRPGLRSLSEYEFRCNRTRWRPGPCGMDGHFRCRRAARQIHLRNEPLRLCSGSACFVPGGWTCRPLVIRSRSCDWGARRCLGDPVSGREPLYVGCR